MSFYVEDKKLKFINYFIGQDTNLIKNTQFNIHEFYSYAINGVKLMKSLTPKQFQKTYLGISVRTDIFTEPIHYKPHLKKNSLNSEKLRKKQIIILSQWINEYLSMINPLLIENIVEELVEKKYKGFNLSWSGSFDESQNKYYFLFNQSIFIEYNLRSNHLHNILRINF